MKACWKRAAIKRRSIDLARTTATITAVALAFSVAWAGAALSEVFGVFRGWVTGIHHTDDVAMPEGVAPDEVVVGCFRYWPEDVVRLHRLGFVGEYKVPGYKNEFNSYEPRSMFAFAVGAHLWRSGGRFDVTVVDNFANASNTPQTVDNFSFGYGTYSRPSKVPPKHPGWLAKGWASAYIGFGSQSPPIEFLSSNELPDSADDFDLPPDVHIAGGAQSQAGESFWSFHFSVASEDMVIRDGGASFGELQEIAAICGDPNIAGRSDPASERSNGAS